MQTGTFAKRSTAATTETPDKFMTLGRSEDSDDVVERSDEMADFAERTRSIVADQRALYDSVWDCPPYPDTEPCHIEYNAALATLDALRDELHSSADRQHRLIEALEARAILLRLKATEQS